MQLVDSQNIDWRPFSQHRPGSAMNKRLLKGRASAPDNYELSLVLMTGDYATPRHRHNFDQFRYMLEGEFGYGRDRDAVQTVGSVGYFPEGVHYEQRAVGRSVTLLFQGGGPSGAGFLGYDELEAGHRALGARGVFENGVYSWTDDAGRKHNKDAYEAIWEHVRERAVRYPAPRFRAPIIADSSNYEWTPSGEAGVLTKEIGAFNERGTAFGFLKLEAGARHRCDPRGLYYILSGSGSIADVRYRAGVAAAPDHRVDIEISCAVPTEIIRLRLPAF